MSVIHTIKLKCGFKTYILFLKSLHFKTSFFWILNKNLAKTLFCFPIHQFGDWLIPAQTETYQMCSSQHKPSTKYKRGQQLPTIPAHPDISHEKLWPTACGLAVHVQVWVSFSSLRVADAPYLTSLTEPQQVHNL